MFTDLFIILNYTLHSADVEELKTMCKIWIREICVTDCILYVCLKCFITMYKVLYYGTCQVNAIK